MISSTDEQQQKIEAYLAKLRGRLRGMNEHEVHEIIRELRAHIADKTVAGTAPQRSRWTSRLMHWGARRPLPTSILLSHFSRERKSTAHRYVSSGIIPLGQL